MSPQRLRFLAALALFCLCLPITGCVTADAPAGVGPGIFFDVTPVYPHSFDIVAAGNLRRSGAVLREAWAKKAAQVAEGRPFRASILTERISEAIGGAWPVRGRSVSGTITILEERKRERE